jgi:hypothetical protein
VQSECELDLDGLPAGPCRRRAARLDAAGVFVDLHVYAGAPFACELLAPDWEVSQRTLSDRHRALPAL